MRDLLWGATSISGVTPTSLLCAGSAHIDPAKGLLASRKRTSPVLAKTRTGAKHSPLKLRAGGDPAGRAPEQPRV